MARKKKNTKTEEVNLFQELEQPVEQPVEEVAEQPVEEKQLSAEEQALDDFVNLYNGLKNLFVITDEQARQFHKYWQVIFHRTDYYTHCGVCSANHIKSMKKLAISKGYTLNK